MTSRERVLRAINHQPTDRAPAFNPDLFHPQEWARAAWDAGMRYFVITAKHHEGFCLWDRNPLNPTKLTP